MFLFSVGNPNLRAVSARSNFSSLTKMICSLPRVWRGPINISSIPRPLTCWLCPLCLLPLFMRYTHRSIYSGGSKSELGKTNAIQNPNIVMFGTGIFIFWMVGSIDVYSYRTDHSKTKPHQLSEIWTCFVFEFPLYNLFMAIQKIRILQQNKTVSYC